MRETLWVGSAVVQTTLAAASTAVQVFTFAAGILALRPFTIIRTRGGWFIQSDQLAATERHQVALGSAVVTEQANAVGVTAVPTPATDVSSDAFFVYETHLGSFDIATAVGFNAGNASGIFKEFDSKAMRKVEDGFDLSTVIETFATSSGALVEVSQRMLIKLH